MIFLVILIILFISFLVSLSEIMNTIANNWLFLGLILIALLLLNLKQISIKKIIPSILVIGSLIFLKVNQNPELSFWIGLFSLILMNSIIFISIKEEIDKNKTPEELEYEKKIKSKKIKKSLLELVMFISIIAGIIIAIEIPVLKMILIPAVIVIGIILFKSVLKETVEGIKLEEPEEKKEDKKELTTEMIEEQQNYNKK